jgi:hypothetical protein
MSGQPREQRLLEMVETIQSLEPMSDSAAVQVKAMLWTIELAEDRVEDALRRAEEHLRGLARVMQNPN